jgi:hypothetical protein
MTFVTTTKLMDQQNKAVAKLLPSKVGALFMEMGTGKSLALIKLAELRQKKWDRLFWFCPVSAKHTILHQWLEHSTLSKSEIEVWSDKVSTTNLPSDKRIHIIGIESMSASDRVYLAFLKIVTKDSFVAVDESSYIKGHDSKRTERITTASENCRYRAVLNGTPISQGAVDLYAQMRFLSPKILGYRSFYSFARNHLEYDVKKGPDGVKRQTKRVVKSHDVDVLAAKVAPYSYQVKKSECMDLPEKIHETRWCHMTPEQKELYEYVKKRILYELEYSDWSSIQIFHLFTSLQTVLCGWYKDPFQGVMTVKHDRLSVLMSAISEVPATGHVIVWAKYRQAVEEITQALSSQYGAEFVHQYYGGQSIAARNQSLDDWRSKGRFLVATQSAGGHALTLNEAEYIFFYADNFKFGERLQAEDRCHRIGQTKRPLYVSIRCAESIDERIADALARKGSALAAFTAEMEDARSRGMKQKAIDMVMKL